MDNIIQTMGQIQAMFEKFTLLQDYIAHLEQGVLQATIEIQKARLTTEVIQRILISAEIVTKEELENAIKEQVDFPIQQFVNAINKQIQENVQKIKKEVEEAVEDLKEAEDQVKDNSNVILASERFRKDKGEEPN